MDSQSKMKLIFVFTLCALVAFISAKKQSMPTNIPALRMYLLSQEQQLRKLRDELDEAKRDLEKTATWLGPWAGRWPEGNYCTLNGNGQNCNYIRDGFSFKYGHIRMSLVDDTPNYVQRGRFGTSSIFYWKGHKKGYLDISTCCK